jgi:hypothetical protein
LPLDNADVTGKSQSYIPLHQETDGGLNI